MIPAATPLHIWWLRSWSLHVTSKLFCFITYLLEDEQELSLGMLIRPKRIYNFLCSMLVLHQLLWVSLLLCGIFIRFPTLTYWQDAAVPVPCFLLFLVWEKLHRKYSRNWTKQKPKLLFSRNLPEHRRFRWSYQPTREISTSVNEVNGVNLDINRGENLE